MQERQIVGVFGGSFNPPHEGHLHIAKYAKEEMGLSEVWALVTPGSVDKDPATYAPLAHRLAMTEKLMQADEALRPTDVEKHFSSTYTADTLKLLDEMHPGKKFVWIYGGG